MIDYLLLAARNALRKALNDDNYPQNPFLSTEIEISPDGKPFPACGNKFIGITGTSFEPAEPDNNVSIDAYLGFTCVLTYRTAVYPQKKLWLAYADFQHGMSAVCWRIMTTLAAMGRETDSVSIFTELALLDGYVAGTIFEYPRWFGTDPEPIAQDAEWFSAFNQNVNDVNGQGVMGYTMSVRFGNARCGEAML